MNLKCGLVGLPNVGKSTLFNVLTNSNIPAKNFPFCTITPNIGLAPVFDERLNRISKIINCKNIVMNFIKFIDIAGLVKGASTGSGLGNQFLQNISKVDMIVHIVRCFTNDTIIHVNKTINPINDIEIVNLELILSDLSVCEKELLKYKKSDIEYEVSKKIVLEKCFKQLQSNKMIKNLILSNEELDLIREINFITLKPVMYVANISDNSNTNIFLDELIKFSSIENTVCIPINILKELNHSYITLGKSNYFYLKRNKDSKINDIITHGYRLLELQKFFTVGQKEIRAWTINKNTTSIEASKIIHTDFQTGFIRAQVISYSDFIKYKGELQAKKFGKVRFEGKKYIIQDGDIIKFLFKV